MSAQQSLLSTPIPPPTTLWPPPLLPSTARNAAQFEAHAPLNLGADDDEQVWTGESVGLGFGLLTKGKPGIDAVNWDCRIWSVSLFPILIRTRCDDLCVCSIAPLMPIDSNVHLISLATPFSEKTANDPCVTRCGHLFCWTHLREVRFSLSLSLSPMLVWVLTFPARVFL